MDTTNSVNEKSFKNVILNILVFIVLVAIYQLVMFSFDLFPHLLWAKLSLDTLGFLLLLAILSTSAEFLEATIGLASEKNIPLTISVGFFSFIVWMSVVDFSISQKFHPKRENLSRGAITYLDRQRTDQELIAKEEYRRAKESDIGKVSLEPLRTIQKMVGTNPTNIQWPTVGVPGIIPGIIPRTPSGLFVYGSEEECQLAKRVFTHVFESKLRCKKVEKI